MLVAQAGVDGVGAQQAVVAAVERGAGGVQFFDVRLLVHFEHHVAVAGVKAEEIAGLDASACVATTAEAALNRGYHVTIREDAILGRSGRRWPKRRARLVKRGALLASAS